MSRGFGVSIARELAGARAHVTVGCALGTEEEVESIAREIDRSRIVANVSRISDVYRLQVNKRSAVSGRMINISLQITRVLSGSAHRRARHRPSEEIPEHLFRATSRTSQTLYTT